MGDLLINFPELLCAPFPGEPVIMRPEDRIGSPDSRQVCAKVMGNTCQQLFTVFQQREFLLIASILMSCSDWLGLLLGTYLVNLLVVGRD